MYIWQHVNWIEFTYQAAKVKPLLQQRLMRIDRVVGKTRFWQQHSQTVLSERQVKVLNRLLDSYGEEFDLGINAR